MKIIKSEKDENFEKNLKADLDKGESIPLLVSQLDKDYWIRFRVTDIAKANCFIQQLFYNKFEDTNVNTDLGLKIMSLDYSNGKAEAISMLENILDQLKGDMQ